MLSRAFTSLHNTKKHYSIFNLFARNKCDKPCKVDRIERTFVYQGIIDADDNDITEAKDAINKGFAYLVCDRHNFGYSASKCFRKAKILDVKNEYKNEIECGINQADKNHEPCYHVVVDHFANATRKP